MDRLLEHREYGDILTSMLLCNHFNPDCDKALRVCLKLVRRRLTSSEMRVLCQAIIKTNRATPLNWLRKTSDELAQHASFEDFLYYARTGDGLVFL